MVKIGEAPSEIRTRVTGFVDQHSSAKLMGRTTGNSWVVAISVLTTVSRALLNTPSDANFLLMGLARNFILLFRARAAVSV